MVALSVINQQALDAPPSFSKVGMAGGLCQQCAVQALRGRYMRLEAILNLCFPNQNNSHIVSASCF